MGYSWAGVWEVSAAAVGSKPVLFGMCPKLQFALSPRGGVSALAMPTPGSSTQLAPGEADLTLAAPCHGSVQTPQLSALLRHLHRPPDIRPPPAAHAVQDYDHYFLCGCGSRHINHQ